MRNPAQPPGRLLLETDGFMSLVRPLVILQLFHQFSGLLCGEQGKGKPQRANQWKYECLKNVSVSSLAPSFEKLGHARTTLAKRETV